MVDQNIEYLGTVTYPGIKQIVSAEYTRAHGIEPDVCMIEMAPQSLNSSDSDYIPIEAEGYLLFQFDEYNNGSLTDRNQILIQDCRADKAEVKRSESSEVWSIPVYDRRWKWKYGSFSGHWNIKKNGVIETRTERTAYQLAEMCLIDMGDTGYDINSLKQLEKSQSLPYREKVRPEVHWDRIAPAEALDQLVTSLGYRVCLGWDDRVRICKYGEGALLPTEDLMSGGFEEDLPEIPSSITVVGGISMHESLWDLEAVGLDLDGEWKPIEHLSYRPEGEHGWNNTSLPNFPGIEQKYKDVKENKKIKPEVIADRKEQLKLAKDTVFRCYRLKYPVGTTENKTLRNKYDALGELVRKGVDLGLRRGARKAFDRLLDAYAEAGRELFKKSKPVMPGPKKKNPKSGKLDDYELEHFEQILPIFETRAELAISPITGKLDRKPTIIRGSFYDPRKVYNTFLNEQIEHGKYEIIPDQGIIRFTEPVIRKGSIKITDDDGERVEGYKPFPADLRVLIAVPLKSIVGEPARFTYEYEIAKKYRNKPAKLPGGLKGNPRKVQIEVGTKVVPDNQIVLAYQAQYEPMISKSDGSLKYVLDKVVTNFSNEELEKKALIAVDVAALRMITGGGGSGVYAGMKKMNIDGAIQQVSISRNESGMTTTISRNQEVDDIVPGFGERQRNLALKEIIKDHNQTVDKTQPVKP